MSKKNQMNGQIVILGEEHSGRDEMNLAGNPFALLQASSKNDQLFIRYEWERQLASGKKVTASWEVQGGGRLGLPGPSEELLYLVLMQLTREAAENGQEWPEIVHFSRVDVLQRMGWARTPKFYGALRDAFARLQAVSIQADHSFWNAKTKFPYESIGFAIIDDYAIAAEPTGRKAMINSTLPLSWFRWNKVLHSSFLAGNVRSLALDFALSLAHPTTRRLFRLLDMMRGATNPPRQEFAIGLFKLRDRLGMTGYKFPSKIKEKLSAAHEELIERGYLEQVTYSKAKDGSALVIYRFQNVQADINSKPKVPNEIRSNQENSKNREQRKVGQGKVIPLSENLASNPAKELNDVQNNALKCHAVFLTLDESERTELIEQAKEKVQPIFHDRVDNPQSPMSLGLWKLVAARYPERVKSD